MEAKEERGAGTRAALVSAAGRLFAERGYEDVSIDEVLGATGLSRGALYHHFADKEDLFRAVLEATEAELLTQVAATAAQAATPLAQLQAGIEASFASGLEPRFRRIILEDGPAVLGWQAWHDIDARYAYGATAAGLQAAMDSGELAAQPVEPLAHLLVGAFMQGAMVIARAADEQSAIRSIAGSMHRLIDGLRPAAPPPVAGA